MWQYQNFWGEFFIFICQCWLWRSKLNHSFYGINFYISFKIKFHFYFFFIIIIFFFFIINCPEYSWKIVHWMLNTNQSILLLKKITKCLWLHNDLTLSAFLTFCQQTFLSVESVHFHQFSLDVRPNIQLTMCTSYHSSLWSVKSRHYNYILFPFQSERPTNFNLCLSVKLDTLSCSFTSTSFFTNCLY